MVTFPRLGKTIRSLLVGGALTLASASFALAQHGGGGHGGGGGSHGAEAVPTAEAAFTAAVATVMPRRTTVTTVTASTEAATTATAATRVGAGVGAGVGWGWPYWGWGWGYPYYGGYWLRRTAAPGGYVSTNPAYSLNPSEWAVVKTDVSPDTTRVFLDGVFVGMTSDFEGPVPLRQERRLPARVPPRRLRDQDRRL